MFEKLKSLFKKKQATEVKPTRSYATSIAK